MSSTDGGGTTAPSGSAAKSGSWGFVGNAAILGVLGTVFASVFQYISAYHDSVANLAKADLDKGVSTLADTVTALSTPLTLQERLIWDYYLANKDNTDADDTATFHTSAHSIYDDYQKSFITLSADTRFLARKMEIYLDLPGDLNHAAANNSAANFTPINNSNLRTSDFDCDDGKYMPAFGTNSAKLHLKFKTTENDSQKPATKDGSGEVLIVNWMSAKDNLVTLEYCFEITHYNMGEILKWASNSADDKREPTKTAVDIQKMKSRAKSQGLRFNDFMSVATFKIEQFRVGYQPNGFFCSLPVISNTRKCMPDELGGMSNAAVR